MYELKKTGKVFTSKFVGAGPSSYKKRIYRAAVSQRLRNTALSELGYAMRDNIQMDTAEAWCVAGKEESPYVENSVKINTD